MYKNTKMPIQVRPAAITIACTSIELYVDLYVSI